MASSGEVADCKKPNIPPLPPPFSSKKSYLNPTNYTFTGDKMGDDALSASYRFVKAIFLHQDKETNIIVANITINDLSVK